MLCAAVGLMLAFVPRRWIAAGLAVLAVAALGSSFVVWPTAWTDGLFLACWSVVVVGAACVHLPKGAPPALAVAIALAAGTAAGALSVVAGERLDLAIALPAALVAIPGAWLVSTGRGIAVKVASSWLIAAALLSAGLSTVHTPGYAPDHME